MKVSVIIPVYNVERFVPKCIDSVISQSLTDIEIICINDGSSDKSLTILQQYEQLDCRIKVISQSNKETLNPAQFLKTLNTPLNDLLPRGQFATLFMGVWDKKKKTLTYAGAGAPNPLLFSKGKEQTLHTEGMPLGISKKPTYKNYKVKLHAEDGLLLYSDALTETSNPDGKRLGLLGLKKGSAGFAKDKCQYFRQGIDERLFQVCPQSAG